MAEKKYTLYANNIDEELFDELKQIINKCNIDCEFLNFSFHEGRVYRGIAEYDICLVCHFVSKEISAKDAYTSFTKIFNEGLGIGVELIHMHVHKDNFDSLGIENPEEFISNCITNSINWCEKHLNVDY